MVYFVPYQRHYTDFTVFFKPFRKQRVYLDYASSTPVDREMLRRFPRIGDDYAQANPSALHKEGVALKKVLSSARALVAETLGGQEDEIVFTSNASESDNLAIVGFLKAQIEQGALPKSIALYVGPFEHSAVENLLTHIDSDIQVCTLAQEEGVVLPESITVPEGIRIVLISVLFVQNEIGTVQPIKEIAKQVRKLRKEHPDTTIIFHTDATQAPLFFDLNVARLGVDMMTLGATKLYTPKGVGVLYKKRGITLAPLAYGGGQEMGMRPGTEPVVLIHQCAHALSYAQTHRQEAVEKITALQRYFEKRLKEALPEIRITGEGSSASWRTPHISHIVIPDMDSELLVLELDARGIAISSKSACKNDQDQDSGIMNFLYPNQALGAIRISYGRTTTKRDLDRAISALQQVFVKYKLS